MKKHEMLKTKILSFLTGTAVILLFCTGLFTRCANMSGSPQGGPKDSLPPVVLRVVPSQNSVNINPKRVTIDFNEYVQLKEFQKEFYTSPFMKVKPTVSVKGRSIVTDIKSDLDSNTTYVINYGRSVVDNNEGNALIGLKYTFSTGPVIDSLYMSGFVFNAKTNDTIKNGYIFFFDEKADSVPQYDSVIFKSKALAVTRTTPNGVFIHGNLKDKNYRVYSMLDNNSNQMYDPGVDEVSFMDTTYNPAAMPAFHLWYDSTLMYTVAEPQIFMRSFVETPSKNQNLTTNTRTEAQKITLAFAAKNPVIEQFTLRDIDSTKIVVEQTRETNDSTIYWLKIPKEELPDTIFGNITYLRPDSAGVIGPYSQELKFVFKKPSASAKALREADKKEREAADAIKNDEKNRKKRAKKGIPEPVIDSAALAIKADAIAISEPKKVEEEADSTIKPSKLKYNFEVASPTIPGSEILIKFDILPEEFDTKGIVLTNTDIKKKVTNVPFTITRDSMKLREYIINAPLKDAEKYNLMIPSGAIRTIDGEVNDTIRNEITVAESSKLATLIVTLSNANPEYYYIIEILDETGKTVLRRLDNLTAGVQKIAYLPTGKVSLRIIEDRNRNGKWDTGDLIKRIQPEKTETYFDATTKERLILTKANWDYQFTIDLEEFFKERVFVSDINHDHKENADQKETTEKAEPAKEEEDNKKEESDDKK